MESPIRRMPSLSSPGLGQSLSTGPAPADCDDWEGQEDPEEETEIEDDPLCNESDHDEIVETHVLDTIDIESDDCSVLSPKKQGDMEIEPHQTQIDNSEENQADKKECVGLPEPVKPTHDEESQQVPEPDTLDIQDIMDSDDEKKAITESRGCFKVGEPSWFYMLAKSTGLFT